MTRRHGVGHCGVDPSPQQDDRSRRRGERAALHCRDLAQRVSARNVSHHDGERLVVTHLAPPKLPDDGVVGGIAHEVVPSDALHGADLAGA